MNIVVRYNQTNREALKKILDQEYLHPWITYRELTTVSNRCLEALHGPVTTVERYTEETLVSIEIDKIYKSIEKLANETLINDVENASVLNMCLKYVNHTEMFDKSAWRDKLYGHLIGSLAKYKGIVTTPEEVKDVIIKHYRLVELTAEIKAKLRHDGLID